MSPYPYQINKYKFSDELIKYCGLNTNESYYINNIISCLENKLEKKLNKIILDNNIKKIYKNIFNASWVPNRISKNGLLKFIKMNKINTPDYSNIIMLKVYDNGRNIQEICV